MEPIKYLLTTKYNTASNELKIVLSQESPSITINDQLYVEYDAKRNIVKFFTIYIDQEVYETNALIKEDTLTNSKFQFIITIDNMLYCIKRI